MTNQFQISISGNALNQLQINIWEQQMALMLRVYFIKQISLRIANDFVAKSEFHETIIWE